MKCWSIFEIDNVRFSPYMYYLMFYKEVGWDNKIVIALYNKNLKLRIYSNLYV